MKSMKLYFRSVVVLLFAFLSVTILSGCKGNRIDESEMASKPSVQSQQPVEKDNESVEQPAEAVAESPLMPENIAPEENAVEETEQEELHEHVYLEGKCVLCGEEKPEDSGGTSDDGGFRLPSHPG